MVLSSDVLERMADDAYKNRILSGSAYCGNCGYNLRTLPYMHVCPECGNEYNARPLVMKGIFLPHEIAVPFGEYLGTIACSGCAFLLIGWNTIVALWEGTTLFGSLDPATVAFAMLFLGLALMYSIRAVKKTAKFIKGVSITRRIMMEEGDE